MKKKLLINTISLLPPVTGIGRYTYEVSKYLESRKTFELTFFYGINSKKLINVFSKTKASSLKLIIIKFPFLKKTVRSLINIINRFSTNKYDLYWEPCFIPIKGVESKKVISTVHDLSFLISKDFHPNERIEYFEKNFFSNIKYTDFIITASYFIKDEIINKIGFEESKIKVIPHGVNHNLFKVYENIDIDICLPAKFIFSVGSIEPRKNLKNLLKAYSSLSKDIKVEYKLVIAGFEGWENDDIFEAININKDDVFYIGFISDDDLAKIYNLASFFIFPSFYEGFGLPILEAMASGTPVLCSNTSSMPEVGGDAALYFNPNNIEDIRNKILQILNDRELRIEMKNKGLTNASKYNWEQSAKEHIKLFEEISSI